MDSSLRILHLEDDPDFPALVSSLLEKEGLCSQVSLASDFNNFLQALEDSPFDLILADYSLPACNGIQALRAARSRCPDTPFLLISGAIGEEAAIESLRCGATDYVMKTALERLVPAVRRAVSEARERAQRRYAETELIRREKYFRTLTENSLDILTILDWEGRLLYNSPSSRTVLGYEPKELAGRNAFELVHPEDHAGARAALGRALQFPNLRVTHEFRFLHKDGSWHYLETVGQNRLDDPEIAGLVLNSRDISDRKKAEAELRENERQYRLIFESNPIPMWISDLESFAFLEVNSAATRHYDYSRQEFLAMTTKDISTPQEAARMVRFLSETVRESGNGVGRAGLWRHLRKDGFPIEVEITWSVIAFRGGSALLTMAQDVTERRRIERREASLSKLSHGLSAANSTETAAQVIREVADDLFDWDCFGLGLYAPETDTLRPILKIETIKGHREEVLLERLRDKPDEVVRRVVRNGAELITESEPGNCEETELFRCRNRAVATRLFAPLRNGQKVIGVLSIQSYQANAYDQQDLHVLQILADQCAAALERLHAEQALRESERRFRSLFEGSPDAIVVADLNANILDANPAACRLWGALHGSMVGRTVTNLIPRNWRSEIVSILARLVAGASSQADCACLTDDGREVPVELSGNCIDYGDKQAVLLHIRDISERKRSAAELKKSEASLVAAQRIAHLGSWELDFLDPDVMERNEIRWSDETYRIFGLDRGQAAVCNELFFQSVHPEDRSRIQAGLKQAFDNREPFEIDHRIVRPDGQERVVRARAEVALDSTGKPIQLRGIVMDITERIRLEEQLRQAQKMEAIGQLAGGVAHDFNNILTVINGHASLLLLDNKLPETAGKSVRQIAQAVERAASLTRQLLTFSRRQVMQPRRLDLNEIVSNLTMMLGPHPRRGHHAAIELLAAPCLHPGRCEHDRAGLAEPRRECPRRHARRRAAAHSDFRGHPVGVASASPDRRSPARPVRLPQRHGHWVRHRARNPAAHLRAVLHYQGSRQRHRAGSGDCLRGSQTAPGLD